MKAIPSILAILLSITLSKCDRSVVGIKGRFESALSADAIPRQLRKAYYSETKGGYGKKGDGKGGKKDKAGKKSKAGKKYGKGGGKKGKSGKKGGKKGGKGGKKGGKRESSLGLDCAAFDFMQFYTPIGAQGEGSRPPARRPGKGKGGSYRSSRSKRSGWNDIYHRHLRNTDEDRALQFAGIDCPGNTFDVALENPDLSIFVELVQFAGLEDVFSCPGPFTVLAPSNSAFQANSELLEHLRNPLRHHDLEEFLLYHILPGFYLSQDFTPGNYNALFGETVEVESDPLSFNQAELLEKDILSCNGAINVIGDFLIPPGNNYLPSECSELDFRESGPLPARFYEHMNGVFHRHLQSSGVLCDLNVLDVARQDADLSTFVTLVEEAGLQDVFLCAGPFTTLIPSNDAFTPEMVQSLLADRELLQNFLLYHILPGAFFSTMLQEGPVGTLTGDTVNVVLDPVAFNNAEVLEADITACNGIIHVIDDTLSNQQVPSVCSMLDFREGDGRQLQFDGEQCSQNVLDVAADEDLTTFVDLVEFAGLQDIFQCAGPFTAWIPTNEAFAALDPALAMFLTDPVNRDQLAEILLYHILPGYTLTTEFAPGPAQTIQGEPVAVTVGPLLVNMVMVVEGDIAACNGVIDKVDAVLLPPGFVPPTASPTPEPTTLAPVTPTFAPTGAPTGSPTVQPTPIPGTPTEIPTISPTGVPTVGPTFVPTPLAVSPTEVPTGAPTGVPTVTPTSIPTPPAVSPTESPTAAPTLAPSNSPSADVNMVAASEAPSVAASMAPSVSMAPSLAPSGAAGGPTVAPNTASPTPEPLIRIRVTDYYLAFVVPGLEAVIPDEDFAMLLNVTMNFWDQYFTEYWAADPRGVLYRGLAIMPEEVEYAAGIPEEKFNYYINFNTTVLYEIDSPQPPGSSETFDIMATANFQDYILRYVRTIESMRRNNEVAFRAQEMLVPARLGSIPSPAPREPLQSVSVAAIAAAGSAFFAFVMIGIAVMRRRSTETQQEEFGKNIAAGAGLDLDATVTDETGFDGTVTDETTLNSQGSIFMKSQSGRAGQTRSVRR